MTRKSAAAAQAAPQPAEAQPAEKINGAKVAAAATSGAAIAVQEAADKPVEFVPLNKLLISTQNVRKSNRDEDIEGLAESIHAKGLLQNLVVSPSRGGREGLYEVDAGGRRLKALELLVKRGDLPRDWPVPVHVVAREDAREASLAENTQKVAMNPADEAEAYRDVMAGYADKWVTEPAEQLAHCARRFGVPERHVSQRLRLVELHPDIFDALRAGRISIETAKAYAGTADQKLQLKVWKEELKSYGADNPRAHEPKSVRDRLAGKVYTADHPAVRYVGLDAYVAAHGRIEPDLFFSAEDRQILLDPSIVDRLAAQKAKEEADQLAQADGWQGGIVKPWTGPSWADPKPPEGYERRYNARDTTPPDRRGEALIGFQLAEQDDGSVALAPLPYSSIWVKPEPHAQKPASPGYTAPTAEQREAAYRAEQIRWRAMRLAAPPIAGTPLEGRAFWPADADSYLDAFEERNDGTCVVALLITVPIADVDAAMAEAAARYDQEQAELAEEEAALKDEAAAADAAVEPEAVE